MFYTPNGGAPNGNHNDVNYDVVLRNCNGKLTQWMDTWQAEMQRAGGETFHFSFLSFFRLYVRLFLNSFGIQPSMSASARATPSLQALSACCTSALDSLRIISKDFASMSMLRYGQDSITVMSAYSAVFLLRLLRSSNTLAQLHEGTAHEIHSVISKTADAYYDASLLSPASTSAAYHARFLRSLVANDIFKSRRNEPERYESAPLPIDPRLQGPPSHPHSGPAPGTHQMYPQQVVQAHEQSFQFPSPTSGHPSSNGEYSPTEAASVRNGTGSGASASLNYHTVYVPNAPHHASELDAHYWKNMFLELGFGDNSEAGPNGGQPTDQARNMPPPAQPPYSDQTPYHHMHPSSTAGYAH